MSEDSMTTQSAAAAENPPLELEKYEFIRDEILWRLADEEMPFMVLAQQLVDDLQDTFDGPVMWYATTVRHDMEARGEIERTPYSNPPCLRVRRH